MSISGGFGGSVGGSVTGAISGAVNAVTSAVNSAISGVMPNMPVATALEHAKLSFKDSSDGDDITFSYNPAELSITKTGSWNTQPQKSAAPASAGKSAPAKQEFLGTHPRKMSISTTFDSRDGMSQTKGTPVADIVQQLLALCEVSNSSKTGGQPEPPIILLTWGSGGYPFECFCDSVNVKYTLFDADGTPLRATVSLSLSEVPQTPDGQNPTSGGVAGRRSHLVTAGDSLQSIAYKEYGRPALWRALAGANDIDDPMRLAPGTRLLIPPRVDAEAYA